METRCDNGGSHARAPRARAAARAGGYAAGAGAPVTDTSDRDGAATRAVVTVSMRRGIP